MFLSFDAPMAFNSLTIFSPKATMLFAASPERYSYVYQRAYVLS